MPTIFCSADNKDPFKKMITVHSCLCFGAGFKKIRVLSVPWRRGNFFGIFFTNVCV